MERYKPEFYERRSRSTHSTETDGDNSFIRKIFMQGICCAVIIAVSLVVSNIKTPTIAAFNQNVRQYLTNTVDFKLAIDNIKEQIEKIFPSKSTEKVVPELNAPITVRDTNEDKTNDNTYKKPAN